MTSWINKCLSVCLSLITISLLFLTGCSPSPEIKATLTFSEPPILGKEVELTATFVLTASAYAKASDVKAEIVLPEGIQKVEGDLQFQGDFVNGQTYEIKATVKSTKTGLWEIEAKAFFAPGEGLYLGGTKVLYLNISENSATVNEIQGALPTVALIALGDSPTGSNDTDIAVGTPVEIIPPKREFAIDQIPNPITSAKNEKMSALTNSLVITGGFTCLVSQNSVPPPGTPRADVAEPMIWGSVYAYNSRTNAYLGAATTGMSPDAGVYHITISTYLL